MEKRELGNFGEELAVRFLRRKGYKILERNFSSKFGEIDIIAQKAGYIIFAEVKLRKNSNFAAACEFVTSAKQRRIITTAMFWLARKQTDLQPRFDVIEIYAPEGEQSRRPEIYHIEDAFQ